MKVLKMSEKEFLHDERSVECSEAPEVQRDDFAEEYIEGVLRRSERDRWEVQGVEIPLETPCKIYLGGKWIWGTIEYIVFDKDFFFITKHEGHPITLYPGLRAEFKHKERYEKSDNFYY